MELNNLINIKSWFFSPPPYVPDAPYAHPLHALRALRALRTPLTRTLHAPYLFNSQPTINILKNLVSFI